MRQLVFLWDNAVKTRGHRLQFRRVLPARLRVERQVAQRPAKVGRLLGRVSAWRGEVLIAASRASRACVRSALTVMSAGKWPCRMFGAPGILPTRLPSGSARDGCRAWYSFACRTTTRAARASALRCPQRSWQITTLPLAASSIALSHTRFWKTMAIFAIEDDPQNGWDHVSGLSHQRPNVISPWAKRKAVTATQYNTTSLLRTMGTNLGLPPNESI